jgi:hypothetical protein
MSSLQQVNQTFAKLLDEIKHHLAGAEHATEKEMKIFNELLDSQSLIMGEVRIHELSYRFYNDPKSDSWKSILDLTPNKFIDGIKEARIQHGLDLLDARDLILSYRDKKYAFAPKPSLHETLNAYEPCNGSTY